MPPATEPRTKNQEPPSFGIASDTRFLYDGWNIVAEFEMNLQSQILNLKSTYAWGLDLSGINASPASGQGAGGVGGLLFAVNHSALSTLNSELTAQAPCYDGNGNITAWVSLAENNNPQLLARYEYDAFGKVALKDESNLPPGTKLPPFGFSTKYTDEETALSYYSYRYYSAEMGRWLSRDPIGIRGGLNLYGMCGNDAVNRWDYLGLIEGKFDYGFTLDDSYDYDYVFHGKANQRLLQIVTNTISHYCRRPEGDKIMGTLSRTTRETFVLNDRGKSVPDKHKVKINGGATLPDGKACGCPIFIKGKQSFVLHDNPTYEKNPTGPFHLEEWTDGTYQPTPSDYDSPPDLINIPSKPPHPVDDHGGKAGGASISIVHEYEAEISQTGTVKMTKYPAEEDYK